MKQNAVVIAGYYGYGNAGDELILLSLVQKVRQRDPATSITVLSRHPSATAHTFSVRAVNRWLPVSWLLPLLRAREFWLGGGGLLQESTGSWNHLYYLGLLVLSKLFGCRTQVQAIGVDPAGGRFNRWLTRWALEHAADGISVRDDDSHRALRLGGVRQFLDVVRDPVLELSVPAVAVDENRVGLAITAWPQSPAWLEDISELTDRMVKELHMSIDFFAFFPAQEEAFIKRVVQRAPRSVSYQRWQNPHDLLDLVGRCSLVIGMRYHALALAALSNRPFIGWGTQRKVRSICQQYNQPFRSFEHGWDRIAAFDDIRRIASAVWPA